MRQVNKQTKQLVDEQAPSLVLINREKMWCKIFQTFRR